MQKNETFTKLPKNEKQYELTTFCVRGKTMNCFICMAIQKISEVLVLIQTLGPKTHITQAGDADEGH